LLFADASKKSCSAEEPFPLFDDDFDDDEPKTCEAQKALPDTSSPCASTPTLEPEKESASCKKPEVPIKNATPEKEPAKPAAKLTRLKRPVQTTHEPDPEIAGAEAETEQIKADELLSQPRVKKRAHPFFSKMSRCTSASSTQSKIEEFESQYELEQCLFFL
jgi:hypothetical protein